MWIPFEAFLSGLSPTQKSDSNKRRNEVLPLADDAQSRPTPQGEWPMLREWLFLSYYRPEISSYLLTHMYIYIMSSED